MVLPLSALNGQDSAAEVGLKDARRTVDTSTKMKRAAGGGSEFDTTRSFADC